MLHLTDFLFFFAFSKWLHPISPPVGATARYCLIALTTVYMVRSIPLLTIRNASFQTAVTTLLQAIISRIQFSCHVPHRLVWRSLRKRPSDRLWALQQRSYRSSPSPHEGNQKESVENRSIRDVLATARTLNPTKMTWRLFCGISEYTRSPLTDTKPVVEEDVILGHIIELHTILMSIIQRANASHVTTYILTPNRLGAIGNPSSTDMVSLQF